MKKQNSLPTIVIKSMTIDYCNKNFVAIEFYCNKIFLSSLKILYCNKKYCCYNKKYQREKELVRHGEDLHCSSSKTFGILRIFQQSLLECQRQLHLYSQALQHPYLWPLLHFWYSLMHTPLSLSPSLSLSNRVLLH